MILDAIDDIRHPDKWIEVSSFAVVISECTATSITGRLPPQNVCLSPLDTPEQSSGFGQTYSFSSALT